MKSQFSALAKPFGLFVSGVIAVFAGAFAFNTLPKAQAKAIEPIVQNTAAPELVGQNWLPSKPISLASRRGKVTIVEFGTFEGANSAAYAKWSRDYKNRGVAVIGVRGDESKNRAATYPVLLDSQNTNSKRWNLRSLPTVYLVDKQGRTRYLWEGELEAGGAQGTLKMTEKINELLNENANKVVKTDAQWRQELSPAAYDVLRNHGTESAGSGSLLKVKENGVYVCGGCDQELFSSQTKFESGTGWPSFYQAIKPGAVTEKIDSSYGMKRTEVLCARCDGHLGHVFEDGPKPTGLRYCMNSVAMKFEKK